MEALRHEYASSSSDEEKEKEGSQQERSWDCPGAGDEVGCEQPQDPKRPRPPPLPDDFLALYRPPVGEDDRVVRGRHQGRTRQFPHEEGNWATHIFIPVPLTEQLETHFTELWERALSTHGGWVRIEGPELHLSLSRTFPLREHEIKPVERLLRNRLHAEHRFVVSSSQWEFYTNDDRSRTFVGSRVCGGHAEVCHLVDLVDDIVIKFRATPFYADRRPHTSLAWCLGDWIPEPSTGSTQSMWSMTVHQVVMKAGNRSYTFPLQ